MCDKKDILLFVIIVIIGIFLWKFYNTEHFDKDGVEFTGYGLVKYDMRGEPYKTRNVTNCYYDKRVCYDDTFGSTEHNTYGGNTLGQHH